MHTIDNRTVYVKSRRDAEQFKCSQPWIAISISSQYSKPKFPFLDKENLVGLLQLDFPDWEPPRDDMSLMRQDMMKAEEEMIKDRKLETFNKTHARKILEFVEDKWDEAEVVLVHCTAGQARSPAIAAAIKQLKEGSCDEFFNDKKYAPNLVVFDTLIETASEGL